MKKIVNILKKLNSPISYFKKAYPTEFKIVDDFCQINKLSHVSWPELKYLYSNNLTKIPVCEVCQGSVKFFSPARGGYAKTCGKKCGAQNPKTKKKFKETNLLKYGVENHAQSKVTQDKMKATNLLRYGVEYASSNKEIAAKIGKHSKKNWLTTWPKMRKGVNAVTLSKNKEIINILDDSFMCLCEKNHHYEINKHLFFSRKSENLNPCTICNDPKEFKNSFFQKEITSFIKDLVIENVIINYVLPDSRLEADIYIPNMNIAIECNGVYWHGEKYAGPQKHLKKLIHCESNNIRLIQIWEDDWYHKKHIIKSMLSNLIDKKSIKIYARKCEIKKITSNDAKYFLDLNHLQGNINAKYRYGLYHNDILVSVMTFGKLRKSLGNIKLLEGEYEMFRFCNELNLTVVGGASKLFSYFLKHQTVKSVTSYSNRDWSIGDLYTKLNFQLDSNTQPGYFWAINNIRYHRYNFRKDKLVKEGFDATKTEVEIMHSRNYYRVYNSGNKKWIYNV